MFLHLSVSQSVHKRCLCRRSSLDRHPLPGQTPPEMVTAADGTHPTGMHSCYCLPTATTHLVGDNRENDIYVWP